MEHYVEYPKGTTGEGLNLKDMHSYLKMSIIRANDKVPASVLRETIKV